MLKRKKISRPVLYWTGITGEVELRRIRRLYWAGILAKVLLAVAVIVAIAMVVVAIATAETVAWNYPGSYHAAVKGYRLYSGESAQAVDHLVADFAPATVNVAATQPSLLNEQFGSDPGTRLQVTSGSWKWVSATRNMKIDVADFMVVFEVAAGTANTFSFTFFPEKSLGEAPVIYVYAKDEALGAYYELRLGGAAGTRYSNWRKCYDSKWGGVEGAFTLPRYQQCYAGTMPAGDNLCDGFTVGLDWRPGAYTASVLDAHAGGTDDKPLNINKIEIIVKDQAGWIDAIVAGGELTLEKQVALGMAPGQTKHLELTAYNDFGESGRSLTGVYTAPAAGVPDSAKGLIILK